MNKKTLLLIDGNALLYRAFYAFPKELSTPTGEIVGAVYGFSRILLSTLKTLDPDAIAVCFDLKGPTFRHIQYPEYKGTRQKMPDELAGQIKRTHEIVEHFEFPIYTAETFEADDVIGTLAKQAAESDPAQKVIILTGDQDILQLVNKQVSVYMPAMGFNKKAVLYTPELVQEKYGFLPDKIIEYKALRGDPSDNIPGVTGVGEVTAKKLIEQFGTIDEIYKNLDSAELKPALLTKLKTSKDQAFLSRELATIVCTAPVTYEDGHCKLELKDPQKLILLFQELGFKSLMRDLPVSHRILSEATDIFTADPTTNPEDLSESEKTDQKLLPILREMETRGVKLDCAYLKTLEQEFSLELEIMKKELFDLAGEEFNPDSPSQVAHTFYETLGIPTTYVRKGKTGFTTDAATLTDLSKSFPIAGLLLRYRELTKLLNTYVKPLQLLVDENSRIHTSYAPDTTSGRISSRDPNLQNIPVRTEQGRRIRTAFVAEKEHILVAADYSQIELRIAAHLSGDKTMATAFKNGDDFHSETATRMGVDRRMAKIINFSILYGKGAYGFSQDMGISVPEAKQYIDQYFLAFPKLRLYLDSILESARKNGFTETLYGRKRYFPDITASNYQRRSAAEREALNMPIQGTAADVLKLAMVALEPILKEKAPQAHMILTVHDELVLEVPENQKEAVAKILANTMKSIVTLDVPLEVTVKSGPNWSEMSELTLS